MLCWEGESNECEYTESEIKCEGEDCEGVRTLHECEECED